MKNTTSDRTYPSINWKKLNLYAVFTATRTNDKKI